MSSLETYRIAVKARVREIEGSTSSHSIPDEDYDTFISNALKQYSKDRPKLTTNDITGASTKYYLVNATNFPNYQEGFSEIKKIEDNAADVSADEEPSYLERDAWDYYRNSTGLYLWLKNSAPTSAETIRVEYTIPHTINGLNSETVDTVPDIDFEAVVYWATAESLSALASLYAGTRDPSIRADVVNYRSKSREFSARASDFKQMYDDWLSTKESYTTVTRNIERGYSFGDLQPFQTHKTFRNY